MSQWEGLSPVYRLGADSIELDASDHGYRLGFRIAPLGVDAGPSGLDVWAVGQSDILGPLRGLVLDAVVLVGHTIQRFSNIDEGVG